MKIVMDPINEFKKERKDRIKAQQGNEPLQAASKEFTEQTILSGYSYNFSWMGRPIIQYPQDILAMQEIIWEVQPDLIIETGIAHGGSIIFYASMLELIGKGEVVGVDIDIREHNRAEIEKHPMFKRIKLIQGSSIAPEIVNQVKEIAKDKKKILVVLDSNHTHEHVLEELKAYAPLVSVNSYAVAFDTIVEYLPAHCLPGDARPWGKSDNPMTAVTEFLKQNDSFVIDESINNKLLVSVAPNGYLKRIR
jgi:cephalosporin hydroxylase